MTHFERPVTPAEITSALRSLIDEIVTDGEPVYVDVRPLEDAPPDECFPLVEELARQHGGELVTGWALWEFPQLFVEAEFHCVWRMPSGELIDPAPKRSSTARVLFLPDPARSYAGRQVNNIRRSVRADPLLAAYFGTFDALFELINRGDRADQHGLFELVGAEAQEFQRLQDEQGEIYMQLLSRFPAVGPYTPCPCGSGKKVRWCHREAVSR